MTTLLILGPIENSVSVKQCPRTQWIWAFNSMLNFLQIDDSHPGIKMVVCATLNDEASLVYHNA